ncbi:MAG TPA: hypothetical protein VFQ42_22420 [Mycobacterium sp.]|nr:hypothetical protein [Mycobacterium sp.]
MRNGRTKTAAANLPEKNPSKWYKGMPSPNPGGRSKAAAVIARLITENTDDGAELTAFPLAVMRQTATVELKGGKSYTFTNLPDDSRSRCYAHDWLTERVAGKAPQVVAPEEPSDEQPKFDDLTDADLEVLAKLDTPAPTPEAEMDTPNGEHGPSDSN